MTDELKAQIKEHSDVIYWTNKRVVTAQAVMQRRVIIESAEEKND